MSMTATFVLAALGLGAPAPAPAKDQWVGTFICTKQNAPPILQKNADGTFGPLGRPFRIRYLDMRIVEETKEHVAVQHDDDVIWFKKDDVLRPRDAVLFFTEVLDKQPENERAISARCWAYMALREFDRALLDAETAVRLSPETSAWKNNRGECFIKRKEYDKAIAEFNQLLKEDPEYDFALLNRGEALLRSKKHKDALSDIEAALKIDRKIPALHAFHARVLATAPDEKLRDGKKALESAQKAIAMLKFRDGFFLDTLAAAHAELGQFEKAVEAQQKAIDDPEFMRDDPEGPRKRLKLYRDKKPFRDE
jgi:tetratricopeptide (TPR) repeat protein